MAGLIPYRCLPPPPPPPLGLDLLFITSSVSPLYYSLGLNASRRSSSRRAEASKPPGQSVSAPLTDCRPPPRLRRSQTSAAWRPLRRQASVKKCSSEADCFELMDLHVLQCRLR